MPIESQIRPTHPQVDIAGINSIGGVEYVVAMPQFAVAPVELIPTYSDGNSSQSQLLQNYADRIFSSIVNYETSRTLINSPAAPLALLFSDDEVTRRQLLQRLALVAGLITAGSIISCAPQPGVPAELADILVQPIKDGIYEQANDTEKTNFLAAGQIPEKWKDLTPEACMDAVKEEFGKVVIPVVTNILGANPDVEIVELRNSIKYVKTGDELYDSLYPFQVDPTADPELKILQEKSVRNTADTSLGVTVSQYDGAKRLFSGNKYIFINTGEMLDVWKKEQQKYIKAYSNIAILKDKALINSLIVRSFFITSIHEIVHFLTEKDRLVPMDQLESIKQKINKVYSIILGEDKKPIDIKDVFYQQGVSIQLADVKNKRYSINLNMIEVFRAYSQELLFRKIDNQLRVKSSRFETDQYIMDKVSIILFDNLNKFLNLNPSIADFRDKDFFGIINIYKEAAKTQRILLTDGNLGQIFNLVAQAYQGIHDSIFQGRYKKGNEDTIANATWIVIQDIIQKAPKAAVDQEEEPFRAVQVFPSFALGLNA